MNDNFKIEDYIKPSEYERKVKSGRVLHIKEMRTVILTNFKIVDFAYQIIFNESIRHMSEFMLLLHTPPPETSFI